MHLHPTVRRLITGSVFASLIVATLAPAAHAGHGWGQTHKYRRGEGSRVSARAAYGPRRVTEYRHYSSGGGSTLAGFIGGLAVGVILSNASPSYASSPARCEAPPAYGRASDYCPPPQDVYCYDDPYCHERFASLELYLAHARHHCRHALIARVIDRGDGECVDVVRFAGGGWERCDWGAGADRNGDWNDDRDE